jgi:hypothetical protein
MPVLITIATVTILFKGSKDHASFLDPAALREKIEKLPEGTTRTEALGIADRLDTLALEYDDVTDASMKAYIADVEKWDSSADKLIEDLQPSDQLRKKMLPELIRLRERLVEILSVEEWEEVFD